MEKFWVLLHGVAIGLSVAIPVGPIALLCMRRTLEHGFPMGFATGLGAAVADLFYSAVLAYGLAAVEVVLLKHQITIRVIGGVFLLILAARTAIRKGAAVREVNAGANGVFGAFASGLALTATNPLTFLGFVGIFAGLGVGSGLVGGNAPLSLVCGVFAGSAAWWLALTTVVARIRHLFSRKTFSGLNLAAALLLAAFGLYALISALIMAAPWLF